MSFVTCPNTVIGKADDEPCEDFKFRIFRSIILRGATIMCTRTRAAPSTLLSGVCLSVSLPSLVWGWGLEKSPQPQQYHWA